MSTRSISELWNGQNNIDQREESDGKLGKPQSEISVSKQSKENCTLLYIRKGLQKKELNELKHYYL